MNAADLCYLHQPMAAIDWFPLVLSIRVALIATALVVLIGVALGWLLARRRFFGREMLDALVTLPLVLPPTVLGYYLLVLLGRNSFPGRAIEAITGQPLVFTWKGAVVAAAVGALPLVVKTSRAANDDPRATRLRGPLRTETVAKVGIVHSQHGSASLNVSPSASPGASPSVSSRQN